jgi:hypothetical protein
MIEKVMYRKIHDLKWGLIIIFYSLFSYVFFKLVLLSIHIVLNGNKVKSFTGLKLFSIKHFRKYFLILVRQNN